jgi:TonB-linked SusC/RagA family outer membrane protein
MILSILQVSAAGYGQKLSLKRSSASLEDVFTQIKIQTGYKILCDAELIQSSRAKKVDFANADIQQVLEAFFPGKEFAVTIRNKTIVIKQKDASPELSSYSTPLQDIQISGTVSDSSTGALLVGVTVQVKGTNKGTTTDARGRFSLSVPDGAVLAVSYIGYRAREIPVNGRGVIDIRLAPSATGLDKVVVVGYGKQKKSSLTAAVSTIDGSAIADQPVGDLSNALGGRASGILFTQPSGEAGNDGATIQIRGIATTGNAQPLLIVDGIPRNYSQLSPSDIASITILKDAAAVAPYGMAGANGVILVTTRRGKIGKPSLTYDGWVGSQSSTIVPKYVSSYQYAVLKNAAAANDGNPAPYTQDVLQKFKDGSDPDAYPNTNPLADILKKGVFQTSHHLGLSGGTQNVQYNMGLGYYYQGGALPNLNYQRYNMSANMDVQATRTTKVSLSLNGRVEDRHTPLAGYNVQSLFQNIISYLPTQPLVFSNGYHSQLYASYYDNPSYQKITGNTLLSQFSIEQQLPVKGLSVKVVGAYDWNPTDPFVGNTGMIQSFRRSWSTPYTFYTIDTTVKPYKFNPFVPTAKPAFNEEYHQAQAFTYQGFVNYAGNFGRNAITGMVVLEARTLKASRFSAGRINYEVPVPELFAGSSVAEDQSNDGTSMETKQRSVVYRFTYAYNDKYLLEADGRYDGSYYFAPGHRFGFFPAFSAAWRLSQETFMKKLEWIDELKIRASYGESGELAGSPFQYETGFQLYGNAAALDNTATDGLYETTEANPLITWERARKSDIGFNGDFWNGLFSIEADYFFEKRNNILMAPTATVPVEYGIGLSQENAGVMSNRGFDLTLGSIYTINNDLRVSLDANFTYARNKQIHVFETSDTYDNPNRRITGRPLGTQFGYKALGYFTADDFDGSGALKNGIATQPWGNVQPGDIRYADLNGNGKIDVDDQTVIGDPTYPAIVYGFSPAVYYKNFELSLLFQGAAMREIQLSEDAVWAFYNGKNAPVTAMDYWTPQNTHAPNPRITLTPTQNNTQVSSWWERSAAYLRLRTGMLRYTIPAEVTRGIGLEKISVYLSGQNLLTWTSLKNFDPELSNNRGWYFPTQKSITAGLHIQF